MTICRLQWMKGLVTGQYLSFNQGLELPDEVNCNRIDNDE